MTREQKIAKAQRLYAKCGSYAQVARQLGVTSSCVQKWLKPEWAREKMRADNAKRGPAKRAWDRAAAGKCSCGAQLSDPRVNRCERCHLAQKEAEGRERIERIIALRSEGLTNVAIAEREGVRPHVVARVLSLACRYGLEVPRSPYWDRAVTASQRRPLG